MDQPTPDVTEADVERVLRRDFGPHDVHLVDGLLAQVDPPLAPRVVLAVLKLSGGSVEAVPAHLDAARQDWRDVIAAAEYPTYMQKISGAGAMTPSQRNEIIRSDWQQYTRWLNR